MANREAVSHCVQCGRIQCRSQLHCIRVALDRALREAGYDRVRNARLTRTLREYGVPVFDGITMDRGGCTYAPTWALALQDRYAAAAPLDTYQRHPQFGPAPPELVERVGALLALLALAGYQFRHGYWQQTVLGRAR